MSDPDQLAADARRTQDALGADVTRLTGRVSPEKLVGTRREKIAHSFAAIKNQVMGIGDSAAQLAKDGATSAADSAHDAANSAGDTSGSAPDAAREKTKGNPVAAGLIAFSAGWLVSSLAPASDAEKKAASTVEGRMGEPLKHSAEQVADNLREPAQQATASVKETTRQAANDTADHAKSAASDVQEHARHAKGQVTGDGNDSGGSYAG